MNNKKFKRIMTGDVNPKELKELIKLADNEIKEWKSFKQHCNLLLKE